MDDKVKIQKADKSVINYATILFLLGIAYLYFVHDIKLIYFLYGSGSWGVGCLVKIILYSLIVNPTWAKKSLNHWWSVMLKFF